MRKTPCRNRRACARRYRSRSRRRPDGQQGHHHHEPTVLRRGWRRHDRCKERSDAVEAVLKAALDGVDVSAATPGNAATEKAADTPGTRTAPSSGRPARAAHPPGGMDPGDDDIPFWIEKGVWVEDHAFLGCRFRSEEGGGKLHSPCDLRQGAARLPGEPVDVFHLLADDTQHSSCLGLVGRTYRPAFARSAGTAMSGPDLTGNPGIDNEDCCATAQPVA